MKIAIIGTHSTGKTTLITEFAHHITNSHTEPITFVSEVARKCPYPINEQSSIDAQIWILKEQIHQENKLHQNGAILLCDRASIDNFAYLLRAARLQKRDVTNLETLAVSHMQSYDIIFKTTRLNTTPKDDGFRSVNGKFRDEIDLTIASLLQKHQLPVINLEGHKNTPVHIAHMYDEFLQKYTSLPVDNLTKKKPVIISPIAV